MSDTNPEPQKEENEDTIQDAEVAAFYGEADPMAAADNSGDTAQNNGEIERLNQELAEAKDQAIRAMAETENTRKRAIREREDASRYAVSSFARDLLSVADNLRRALETTPQDDNNQSDHLKALCEGVEATERELLRVFEQKGIKPVEALNMPFDPNVHEVMFEASDPTKPVGTIVQVVQTGYMLHDRLLRPARVGIVKDDGQGKSSDSPTPEAGSTINTEA